MDREMELKLISNHFTNFPMQTMDLEAQAFPSSQESAQGSILSQLDLDQELISIHESQPKQSQDIPHDFQESKSRPRHPEPSTMLLNGKRVLAVNKNLRHVFILPEEESTEQTVESESAIVDPNSHPSLSSDSSLIAEPSSSSSSTSNPSSSSSCDSNSS